MVLPGHAQQLDTVHMQSQALSRDADDEMVPVSIGETIEWDPTHIGSSVRMLFSPPTGQNFVFSPKKQNNFMTSD